MKENGIFERMCKDAADEVASGEAGWRDIETNVLLLAAFHLLTNHLSHKLGRPLWWFAGAVSAGVVGYLVQLAWRGFAGG